MARTMIRILFRGYDKMKGWVYGDLAHAQGVGKDGKLYPRIMVAGYEVDQKSVGIATGVLANNGREIYTGDIIKVTHRELHSQVIMKVVWRHNAIMVVDYKDPHDYGEDIFCKELYENFDIEIIGNEYMGNITKTSRNYE